MFTRRRARAGSIPPHDPPPHVPPTRAPDRHAGGDAPSRASAREAPSQDRAARHRPPRRDGLPARAHPRVLRARDPPGRRLHRARPRDHQGRRARRAPRERDLRHHGRRRPPGVRRPPARPRPSTARRRPAGSPRTSPSPSSRRCARRSGCRDMRPQNTAYDGHFEIPTFEEVHRPRASGGAAAGRPIGIYPETKHPTYFRALGLPLEEPLVRDAATRNGSTTAARDRCSSSRSRSANLRAAATAMTERAARAAARRHGGAALRLRRRRRHRAPTPISSPPQGLRWVSRYAAGAGPSKDYIVPRDAAERVAAAHDVRRRRPPGAGLAGATRTRSAPRTPSSRSSCGRPADPAGTATSPPSCGCSSTSASTGSSPTTPDLAAAARG